MTTEIMSSITSHYTHPTISLAEAETLLQSIRDIMAETNMNFAEAGNEYIRRNYPQPKIEEQQVDMSGGWAA